MHDISIRFYVKHFLTALFHQFRYNIRYLQILFARWNESKIETRASKYRSKAELN